MKKTDWEKDKDLRMKIWSILNSCFCSATGEDYDEYLNGENDVDAIIELFSSQLSDLIKSLTQNKDPHIIEYNKDVKRWILTDDQLNHLLEHTEKAQLSDLKREVGNMKVPKRGYIYYSQALTAVISLLDKKGTDK